jgi:hypothetical protein
VEKLTNVITIIRHCHIDQSISPLSHIKSPCSDTPDWSELLSTIPPAMLQKTQRRSQGNQALGGAPHIHVPKANITVLCEAGCRKMNEEIWWVLMGYMIGVNEEIWWVLNEEIWWVLMGCIVNDITHMIHGAGILMLTWLGYIDGIHGTPYIAAPWILWVMICSDPKK